jgi:hypothetical protein
LAELANALAERPGEPRQPLRPEHDQGDDRDEDQVYGALDTHVPRGRPQSRLLA